MAMKPSTAKVARKPLSDVQREALHGIAYGKVYVTRKGQTDSALKAQTVASLVTRGLVQPNGASRGMLGRYSTRRLVLTAAGKAEL